MLETRRISPSRDKRVQKNMDSMVALHEIDTQVVEELGIQSFCHSSHTMLLVLVSQNRRSYSSSHRMSK